MQKWKTSLELLLLGVASVAQESSGILSQDGRRVGGKLACLCGGCKNSVGDCPMLECHYASPARQKIMTMQADGKADQTIVDAFVADRGKEALVAPPKEGFSLLAWWMPAVAVMFGLWAIWMAIRRFSRPIPMPVIDPSVVALYKDQIEKDVDSLD